MDENETGSKGEVQRQVTQEQTLVANLNLTNRCAIGQASVDSRQVEVSGSN